MEARDRHGNCQYGIPPHSTSIHFGISLLVVLY
jgi:hypothetical protein